MAVYGINVAEEISRLSEENARIMQSLHETGQYIRQESSLIDGEKIDRIYNEKEAERLAHQNRLKIEELQGYPWEERSHNGLKAFLASIIRAIKWVIDPMYREQVKAKRREETEADRLAEMIRKKGDEIKKRAEEQKEKEPEKQPPDKNKEQERDKEEKEQNPFDIPAPGPQSPVKEESRDPAAPTPFDTPVKQDQRAELTQEQKDILDEFRSDYAKQRSVQSLQNIDDSLLTPLMAKKIIRCISHNVTKTVNEEGQERSSWFNDMKNAISDRPILATGMTDREGEIIAPAILLSRNAEAARYFSSVSLEAAVPEIKRRMGKMNQHKAARIMNGIKEAGEKFPELKVVYSMLTDTPEQSKENEQTQEIIQDPAVPEIPETPEPKVPETEEQTAAAPAEYEAQDPSQYEDLNQMPADLPMGEDPFINEIPDQVPQEQQEMETEKEIQPEYIPNTPADALRDFMQSNNMFMQPEYSFTDNTHEEEMTI